jgi:hypothetical protein
MKKKEYIIEEVQGKVRMEISNKPSLMLHSELASGKYGEEHFRLIMSANGTCLRAEYCDYHVDVLVEDITFTMLNLILTKTKEKKTS